MSEPNYQFETNQPKTYHGSKDEDLFGAIRQIAESSPSFNKELILFFERKFRNFDV